MRILITNDDGINAPGLKAMMDIAQAVAGPDGEVWTVAPAFEQSGVGHMISYTHPTMIAELAPRNFAAEGSPADCVLAALCVVMKDNPPDLILSGVNRGNNAGENVPYSGTIGAAMEAALQGLPAIALSQYWGPYSLNAPDPFAAARHWGPKVIKSLLEKADWNGSLDYRLFYNINFPAADPDQIKGVRVAAQGRRQGSTVRSEEQISPTGRRFLWARSGPQDVAATPDSDVDALMQGYISVTPLRADFTCHQSVSKLAKLLNQG